MSDYIKLFETVEDQNEFLNSGNYVWPMLVVQQTGVI